MDNTQHLILSHLREQTIAIQETNKRLDSLTELQKELVSINRELLTFFVAIDERESGSDSTAGQEYLTELEKDGFSPKSG